MEQQQYELLYKSQADKERKQKLKSNPYHQMNMCKKTGACVLIIFLALLLMTICIKLMLGILLEKNNLKQDEHFQGSKESQGLKVSSQQENQKFLIEQSFNYDVPEEILLPYLLKEKKEIVPENFQFSYYENRYGISKFKELPLCIIAPERNNMENNRQERFLESVKKQNYSNFHLILCDDNSNDETVNFTERYLRIPENDQLRNRTTLLPSATRKYSLYHKNKAIVEYCSHGSIIIDVDADDQFIGKEVFHVVNALYQKYQQNWYIYTNYLTTTKENKFQKGVSSFINWKRLQGKYYRVGQEWVTSHLKTYRRDLYLKINQEDFVNEEGEIFRWASDRFIQYSLVELAGKEHSRYEDIVVYYYDQFTNPMRNFDIIRPDKLKSQTIRPYKGLQSLDNFSERVEDYEVPEVLAQKLRRAKASYQSLVKRSELLGISLVD